MAEKRVAFVTDSTAFLTEELRSHPDVYVVPIVVISEGREYEDGIDLTSDELYNIIRNSKEVPKTSQPSVGRFQEVYQQLQKNYDHAIAIHVSGKLSGTVSSSMTAKDQVGFDVEVIDSKSLSFSITELLSKGLQLADEGVDVKEIANVLREEKTRSKNLILLGSLEQLYKGGRMSGASFLLGNVLQIKPILTINSEGELGLLERVRSEKKAVTKLIDLLKQSCEEKRVKQLGIMHANVLEKAEKLKQRIQAVIPNVEIVIGEISSSLAVHAGEESLAVFWHTEK
ncbi:DegV family protein [Salinibacillus xinjiangensis]|uniref:DegV family EDD domain-containing protein n=1 Tax=Salinibacillus xinjiangensis TaxID=1229268 RepID=A0A6G1X589_9BACI|nr:DegV family protein [Salinibacillus xinjiangensis]MRG86089.1 DegV family EDD domain-containing protein [Salinibacillus xinjiangensis]